MIRIVVLYPQSGRAAHGKTLTDDMPNYTKDVIVQIREIVNL